MRYLVNVTVTRWCLGVKSLAPDIEVQALMGWSELVYSLIGIRFQRSFTRYAVSTRNCELFDNFWMTSQNGILV
jgi:hypothetical protein